MNLLTDKIKTLYFHYFVTVLGGSLIPCVYGIVDMAVLGQYYGPDGTAAMTVVMPIFNIIYGLGMYAGIGGSILYSTHKGKNPNDETGRNEYYTVAFLLAVIFSAIVLVLCWFFEEPLLYFFGADKELLPLSKQYFLPIKIAAPLFLFTQLIGAFLRNDNAPELVTKAVLVSGVFNIFGDVFFVFGLDLGMTGAAMATSLGAGINLVIQLTHFASKSNTIHLVKINDALMKAKQILSTGFSSFFNDFAMGIVNILFNRQIMAYLGSDALSVFGILMNLNTFVQCCGYSVGQAAQPIISMNYGAGKGGRIKKVLKYSVGTSIVFGVMWLALVMAFPNGIIRIFMTPTEEVLSIAPAIMRKYSFAFLLIPFNVFSVYYFQALMKARTAFLVTLLRGLLLCSLFVYLLPAVFGANALWFAMPVTEAITAVYAAVMTVKYTRQLKVE